jgi:hypothetical protein
VSSSLSQVLRAPRVSEVSGHVVARLLPVPRVYRFAGRAASMDSAQGVVSEEVKELARLPQEDPPSSLWPELDAIRAIPWNTGGTHRWRSVEFHRDTASQEGGARSYSSAN